MASVTTPREVTQPVARPSRLGAIVSKIIIYLILGSWAIIVIFPMLWSVMTAFKTDQEIFFSPWALPAVPQWDNFVRAWTTARIGEFLVNTLLIIIPSLFFTLLLSAMASYVLARFEFRGRSIITYTFLVGMIFPLFLALVPLYFVMQKLHLLDTFPGLILVYIAFSLPFTIFFLTNFFRTLPKELGEAATIDGANQYDIFFRVYLPLTKPGLVTMGIFNFLGQWNQYILPNTLMITNESGNTHYVLSQGLYYLQAKQFYQSDWSGLFAAVAIVMVPTLLIYLIFSNQIEQGMTAGAIKG
ncbi:MAG TPA: carbohydrate ABC transporter permease [Roseiflexaceae bacterium]|nr:carbohydrate ABC transporter permease [Roseiflexaceae bacterium]